MDLTQLAAQIEEAAKDYDEVDFVRFASIQISGVKDGRKIDKTSGGFELWPSDGRCLPLGPAPIKAPGAAQVAPRIVSPQPSGPLAPPAAATPSTAKKS